MTTEQYIIALIREGKANREIAEVLHTTEGTVKDLVHKLLKKYNCRNRVQLAFHAELSKDRGEKQNTIKNHNFEEMKQINYGGASDRL